MLTKKFISFLPIAIFISGCVGSPVHMTMRYSGIQSSIRRNNDKLLNLKIGMFKDNVIILMGKPERSEGYAWGSALLYRTAMTTGVYGTADSDFTPVVFNENGKLVGWGRNFFTEHVKKFEVMIKSE